MVVDTLPDMMKECPICLEALFDEQGIAQNGSVAKIMCFHLVHSECLRQAGQSLNSDGKRFGVGGFGPRSGCPVCNRPVSMWIEYEEAAAFPIFWMKRILNILEEIGPSNGPVAVNDVLSLLKNDSTLTKKQKSFLKRDSYADDSFEGALKDGSHYITWEQDGGSEKMYKKKLAWDWNKSDDTLWLYKWESGKFSVGDLVRIHGLVSKPQFNQTIGVVKAYHANIERYEIQPSRGSKTLAIKGVNLSDDEFLKPCDDKFKTQRAFDNVFFWPSPNTETRVPIHCFSDCPSVDNPSAQDTFIKRTLGWTSVDTLGGIEEKGRDKPTFLLLFDGLDESSPKNHAAMAIAKLLPKYKVDSCSRYKGIIRGVATLIYSPTKSTFSTSLPGMDRMDGHQMIEANANRRFTPQLLYDVIEFHHTTAAERQYKAHDNPMHRVFGGLHM